MEYFEAIFTDFARFQLAAVLAGALFFAMSGFRALKDEHVGGLVHFLLSTFLLTVHGYLLFNLPSSTLSLQKLGVQYWLFEIFAPVLAILFLVIGVYNFLNARGTVAMVKILLGISFIGLLFILGQNWPGDIRGIMIVVWSVIWFKVELKTAQ